MVFISTLWKETCRRSLKNGINLSLILRLKFISILAVEKKFKKFFSRDYKKWRREENRMAFNFMKVYEIVCNDLIRKNSLMGPLTHRSSFTISYMLVRDNLRHKEVPQIGERDLNTQIPPNCGDVEIAEDFTVSLLE